MKFWVGLVRCKYMYSVVVDALVLFQVMIVAIMNNICKVQVVIDISRCQS